MAKTKPKELEQDEMETPPAVQGPGEQMRVMISGSADKVTKRLGLKEGDDAGGDAKVTLDPSASGKFFDLLKDPRLVAVVSRTQPREFGGFLCRAEVDRFDLPSTLQDIIDQVRENHGGRKYRIALKDPHTGRTVDAENFEIDGDPILPDQEEIGTTFEEEPPPTTPLDEVEELTRKEIKSATQEAELITARKRLSMIRDGNDPRSHAERPEPGVDPKIQLLERQIADMERRSELRAIEDRHAREMAELKKLVESKPTGESASDKMFQLMMAQMKQQSDLMLSQQKSSDEKFAKMMDQMQNQKLDQVMGEIRDLKKNKDEGGLAGQIEMVKNIADLLGVPLGGKDEEDKEWYEKLAEDSLPRILDMLDGKRKDGKQVTKEDLIREIDKETDRVIAEKTEEMRKKGLGGPPRQLQQAPAPPPLPAPPRAAAPPGQLPPLATPLDTSNTLPPAPPAAAPPPPPPIEQMPSIEEERLVRCAAVMTILDREIMVRPKQFQWNYSAWQNLPEDLLERFATATDLPTAIESAFHGAISGDQISRMQLAVTADERVKQWGARGFKELQGWWQEALKDPDFDPADDGEEEADGDDL